MDILLILALVFSATFLALTGLQRLLHRRLDPTYKRMQELAGSGSAAGAGAAAKPRGMAQARVGMARLLEVVGRRKQKEGRASGKMMHKLMSAGYYQESALRRFMGIKRLCAVTSFILFLLLGHYGRQPLPMIFFLGLLGAMIFYTTPDLVLNSQVKRRQHSIAGGLPDALDLMVICVEAGLGLNAAILRVGQDLALRCRPLSEELLRTTQDLRTGISRESALRAMSQRNQVEDLKILVGALVLADKLGTSIADTLRCQADSLRTRIKQKAEEQAAKAGVKMLLPLVLFILPALFIILLGPAALMMLETLAK
ncbi:MAG TPA: type II secretion system F family protein [bacterium]|mgnify:CR=1 FL=1|nr:type II secretion system F family protein [bacterium]HQI48606.1 type II secretion system F family protein [bacterium]HQJ63956.1 type II secretion system F family protein [bacterium]